MLSMQALPALLSAGLAGAGLVQGAVGYASVRRFMATPGRAPHALPAVTVLKPLHGLDAGLEQALESFFRLDYPAVQLVFGVQDPLDAAIGVVERLALRYPAVDATLVCDTTPHGANRKVANLINMFPSAVHDVLVISDSDIHVAPDYLRQVVGALQAPGVGLVSSIYIGLPSGRGLTAQLGAAYINQIFASGALMARGLGRQDCMGATMGLTRQTLMRIGGFPALSPFVADDGILGRKVRALGLDVVLAAVAPATSVAEVTPRALFSHELRWARTIRAMAPIGFLLSAIQYPVFWAALATLCAGGPRWAFGALACVCGLRALAGRGNERALGAARTALWLAPLRDLMSIAVMVAAYFGDDVAWRGQVLSVAPDRALVHAPDNYGSAPTALAHGEG